MVDKKGDSKNSVSEGFDIGNELSALVDQNIIPSRIADKLEKKLKEKNAKINKEQLHALAYKIRDFIDDYIKSGPTTEQSIAGETDVNMQKLVETIKQLQERIANIESGKPPRTVTTDDIQIPKEWEMDPLTKIPNDPESIIVLMKWLQHLIDKCGRTHLSDVLDYYVDIGWISVDAKISLIDYSHGITEEEKKGETPRVSDLPARDHIQSLMFIQKLKGRRFDKHFLDRIDGEISRITKKLDNYHNYHLK